MNEMFLKHGAISWNELMTSNVDGAKNFASDLGG